MFGKRCRKRLFVVVGAQREPTHKFWFSGMPLIARYFAAFLFWFSNSTRTRQAMNNFLVSARHEGALSYFLLRVSKQATTRD
jgi:hypothetical protein